MARPGWPDALDVGPEGSLVLDGCDLGRLAEERGTPLWVVSRSTVEGNFTTLLSAFRSRYEKCEIAYSVKANNNMAVVSLLHAAGARMDCSSEFEFRLALLCGVPASDVILNGNGKSENALRDAVTLGVRQVNVDSVDEVRRLEALAAEAGVRVSCVVRVQLAYRRLLEQDPSFESTLRVAEGKFGSNVENGQAMETVEAVLAAPHLDFCGFSHHVGFSGYMGDYSPDNEVMHHRECTLEICAFANEVRRVHGVEVDRLDLGGGFRSGREVLLSTPGDGTDLAYHPLPSASDYADAIFGTVEAELEVAEAPLIQFETGGYQIANAVLMLVSVVEVKDVAGARQRYVTVDGSMMMFVGRGSMRVGHPIVRVDRPEAEPLDGRVTDVVGQTCVYDSIGEQVPLPDVAPGDVLALLHQGAYCEAESTQFNAFPRPEVVLVDRGSATVVKRRETFEDIHARDVIPAELREGGTVA